MPSYYKIVTNIAIVAVCIICIVDTLNNSTFKRARSEARYLVQENSQEALQDRILEDALNILSEKYSLPKFQVNQTYSDSIINFYVIKFDNTSSSNSIHANARNNIVSVAPNIIFADEGFIKTIINEYFNFMTANQQLKSDFANDWGDVEINRTYLALQMLRQGNLLFSPLFSNGAESAVGIYEDAADVYARYSNFSTIEELIKAETEYNPRDVLDSGIRIMLTDRLLSSIEEGKLSTTEPQKIVPLIFSEALAFILLHEFHHLESGSTSGFQPTSLFSTLAVEEAADKAARNAIESGENDYTWLGAYFSANFVAEMSNYAAFSSISGFDPQKFGTFITYNDQRCPPKNDIFGTWRGDNLGFFDLRYISNIGDDLFPLLDESEFRESIDNVAALDSHTHGTITERAARINPTPKDGLEVFPLVSTSAGAQRNTITKRVATAFANADISEISDIYFQRLFAVDNIVNRYQISDSRSDAQIETTSDLKRIFPTLIEYKAAFCPLDSCLILKSADNRVRVDIAESGGRLRYASVSISQLAPIDWDGYFYNLPSGKDFKFNLLNDFLFIHDNNLGGPVVEFFNKYSACGFAHLIDRGENTALRVSAIGNQSNLRATIFWRP